MLLTVFLMVAVIAHHLCLDLFRPPLLVNKNSGRLQMSARHPDSPAQGLDAPPIQIQDDHHDHQDDDC